MSRVNEPRVTSQEPRTSHVIYESPNIFVIQVSPPVIYLVLLVSVVFCVSVLICFLLFYLLVFLPAISVSVSLSALCLCLCSCLLLLLSCAPYFLLLSCAPYSGRAKSTLQYVGIVPALDVCKQQHMVSRCTSELRYFPPPFEFIYIYIYTNICMCILFLLFSCACICICVYAC